MLGAEYHKTLVTMNNLASTYRNCGRWDNAEKLGVDVMKLRKALLGPDHPFTLSIMCNLASTYSHQGRWDEAEKLLIDVTNASKAKLGPDHLDTLTSMANLASTYYRKQGRLDDAHSLCYESSSRHSFSYLIGHGWTPVM